MDKINHIITLLENGHYDKALPIVQDVIDSGTDEERFLLGEELINYGFLEEGKALFEKLLEVFPDEGEILVSYAETCIELGEEEKGMLALRKVKEEDPFYPQALLLLADLYQMEGLYEVSEQKLLAAKSILPDEAVIDFALGELYLEVGKFKEAILSYEKAMKKQEVIGGVNLHQRVGDAYSAGGAFEEALPHYEKALKAHLEINTLFNYALTAFQAGQNHKAIKSFNELKELDPEYHPLYLYLAKAYEKEREYEKSFEVIQEGIRYDEFNRELLFYGGKIALMLGKEDDGEDLLKKALELDPEYIEAGLTLSKMYLHEERYEEVLNVANSFAENNIEEPRFLWDGAVALEHLERYSEALDKYQSAYKYFKNDGDFLADYGYFLIEEGKRKEAAEIFTKLLKLDPGNDEFADMLERLSDG